MSETTTTPLRRSSTDRIVGGVAGGTAKYLGIDPAIVRIGFALTILVGGIGFVAYLLAWIFLPADDPGDPSGPATRVGVSDGPRILGALLVFVAAASVLDEAWWAGELLLPVALIAVGAWLIFRPDRPRPLPTTTDRDDTSPEAAPPPPPPPATPVAPPPPKERDPRFPTARATTGVLALTAGGLWLAAANGAGISLEAALTICLAICGTGLVAGAFLGRSRPLIALALPLALALVAASAIDVPIEGGVGDRSYAPARLDDVRDEYRLAVGEVVLDLRDLDPESLRGTTTTIDASIALGSLQVLVPRHVTVTGSASAQIGDIDVQGDSQSGATAERRIDIVGEDDSGTIELDLRVGIGEIQVR